MNSEKKTLPGPAVAFDYGSTMLTNADARAAEIAELSAAATQFSGSSLGPGFLVKPYGVTVVIPTFRGVDRIGRCLQSLAGQDLDPQMFEVVLVVNGGYDGTQDIARSFRYDHPQHRLRIVSQSNPGAGAARNLGIAAARFSYLTMVDDDDYVGPEFLSALLATASPQRVSIAPIIDLSADGREYPGNALNAQIRSRAGTDFKLASAPGIVGFNACKLFPTEVLQAIRYAEDLSSGEDVFFMASAALYRDFDARVSTSARAGAYFRVLRDDSISRQSQNFDFAVTQRLAVIRCLESLRLWDGSPGDALLVNLIKSQAGFVKRYLIEHSEQRGRVIETVEASGVKDFPWALVNEEMARHLAVSYCFAPFADTSAVVAAKAIVERGNIVDVVSNDMGKVREIDSNLSSIAARFVDQAVEIDAPPSFAGWKEISEFVAKGIAAADRLDARKGGYRTLYSRVQWPGSHFLAALFKLRHPAVIWSAEFSDPLSHDAAGRPREGVVAHDQMFEVFRRGVAGKGYSLPKNASLFVWCEFLSYVLADELIFTNDLQLRYMLGKIPDARLRKEVVRKAVVRAHPTPPRTSYSLINSDYFLSPSVLNIGYFGNFYENRSLSDVLTALANSPADVRRQTRLHVFTSNPDSLTHELQALGLTGSVVAQGYRPYLEFLNLTTRFDVLLVNDVERVGNLDINPFLPSKYSDYVGSGRPIWGLLDEGSALSGKTLAYRSTAGNAVSALATLRQIHADWRPGNRVDKV
ncbi:putative glycosyltransferase EpsH [Arthrobacter sp. SO5]|uniref:glycosyltransferase n=1 Tax=Arthrobacter sp. SO5 TaxID=1897055 RepID=UPI001E2AB8BA|nr:glycosyltransferase [Arthrobacter sp. SO5]MCB5274637.1 putative glycosyltransferase EpsH [Arthrobacter sp. SO5]